jgi:hypothetical protein
MQLGREVDHSSPSSTEIENEWSYTSTPLHGVDRATLLSFKITERNGTCLDQQHQSIVL